MLDQVPFYVNIHLNEHKMKEHDTDIFEIMLTIKNHFKNQKNIKRNIRIENMIVFYSDKNIIHFRLQINEELKEIQVIDFI